MQKLTYAISTRISVPDNRLSILLNQVPPRLSMGCVDLTCFLSRHASTSEPSAHFTIQGWTSAQASLKTTAVTRMVCFVEMRMMSAFFLSFISSSSSCLFSASGMPSERTHVLEHHTDEVWMVRFSHDGSRLASASRDKTVVVWDMSTLNALHVLRGHDDGLFYASFQVSARPSSIMIDAC